MEVSCVSHGSSTPFARDDGASSKNDAVEWSFEENKMFENALAKLNLDAEDLFERLCCFVPGKTIEEIKQHYEALVEDVNNIELGYVPLPDYNNDLLESSGPISHQKKKKKGARWTKEEHENFLAGLDKYGKGDWKSISRNCVLSKTPTQVASHAQKYYLKLEKSSKPTKASTSSATTSQDNTRTAMDLPHNP